MSLTTPTTKEIGDNIIAQLEASLNQSIPLLPKSFLRVLSKALAGVFVLLYKYAGFMFLQMFVRTASANPTVINGVEVVPLTEWGRLIGVGDPTAATHAELLIDIDVTNQTGTLPSGSQLVNTDNGVTYITIGAVNLNAAVVQATVRAVSDQVGGGGAGVVGNLDGGATVSFANPLPNVARAATVVSQTVTGADAETTEAYRQRVTDRFQKRPQGGAYADYEQWGEEVAGIINVYPYTDGTTPGQVTVYSEATVASSGSADGIPTPSQLVAVEDSITFDSEGRATRKPTGAFLNSMPITRQPLNVEVTGLVASDPATVEASITAGVEQYFSDGEPWIAGLSVLPRKDRLTEAALGGLVDSIVAAAGGTFTSLALVAPEPTYDSVSKIVTPQASSPRGIFFKPDGTKMYMLGNGGVHQYTLASAWNVGTASYDSISKDVTTEDTDPTDVFFNPDGTKMYVAGATGDNIYQYTLATAWNAGTATYDSVFKSIATEDTAPTDVFFRSDGLKMYVIGAATGVIYQYTLGTAWNVGTASYDSISKDVTTEDTSPQGVFFKPDGLKMYVVGGSNGTIYQYTLSVAWDLSTATYDSVGKSVATEDPFPASVFFRSDGRKMYVAGATNGTIYQYTLATAWDMGSTPVSVYSLGEGEKAKSGGVSFL